MPTLTYLGSGSPRVDVLGLLWRQGINGDAHCLQLQPRNFFI